MSYNFDATISTHNEVHIGLTSTTELLDAILTKQSYAKNGRNYERSYGSEDSITQIKDLLDGKNKNYLQLLAYTTAQVLKAIVTEHLVLRDDMLSDESIATLKELSKKYVTNNTVSSKFTVDDLLKAEASLADFDGSLYETHLEFDNGFAGDRIFYLFLVIATFREAYTEDPTSIDQADVSFG